MNQLKKILLAAGLVCLTVLFTPGCAEEDSTTYPLSGGQAFRSMEAAGRNDDRAEDEAAKLPQTTDDGENAAEDGSGENESQDTVLVHICGEVQNPGVYELTAEKRICDVLLLAGGFTDRADTEAVNMAAGIEDGMQVVIPREAYATTEEAEANALRTGNEATGKNASEDSLVNINTADRAALMSLPGIGAGKAQAIIAYREAGGSFVKTEDIMLVDGIKEGVFARIKDKICVK